MMTLADRLRRYSQGKDTAMGNDLIKAADQIERLEKAIQHCDPLCPAWAELEGRQEKERCPHLAGDLCVKEGACECYGAGDKRE